MRTVKSFFMGKDDPDRISLENVFPIGDLVFSMPFGAEQGKHHRVIIEGDIGYLECFDDCASSLLESESDPFGRWVALTNYILEPSLELIYEPRGSEFVKAYRLLVCILRRDLIAQCDLRLSPVARITATRGHIQCVDLPVLLPEGTHNGSTELAPLIAVSSRPILVN